MVMYLNCKNKLFLNKHEVILKGNDKLNNSILAESSLITATENTKSKYKKNCFVIFLNYDNQQIIMNQFLLFEFITR